MIEFVLSKGIRGKARFWIDELPASSVLPVPNTQVERTVVGVRAVALHTQAAVEFFRPMGGHFHYGLLGADFSRDCSGTLVVTVPTGSAETGAGLTGSLAGRLDRVTIGGTPQYAAAVLAGVQETQSELLPSGRLTFSHMAHGTAGSAPIVFRILAVAVVRLLMCHGGPGSEDEATTFLT